MSNTNLIHELPYSDAPRLSKAELTAKHNGWLGLYPKSNDLINRLENKWGHLLFTPLDIPKIEVSEEFVNFYFSNADYSYKRLDDIASARATPDEINSGRSTFLTIDSKDTTEKCIWSKNYIPDMFIKFKDVFDQIYEYFPLNSPIKSFSMWSSTSWVPFHRDASNMLNLPIQFRILLHNPYTTTDTTLRLKTDAPEKENNNYFRVHVPKETNCFAWNNLKAMHGSTFFGGKKILFIPAGVLDINWKRYDEMLEKSYMKYKDLLLLDPYQTSDYINE